MSIKTFARTISGTRLKEDGDRVLLQYPQTMAQCVGHKVPYQMPHTDGGFLVFAEYGAPDCGSCDPNPKTTCESCGCKPEVKCGCPPKPQATVDLLCWEMVEYSGYEDDGQTLVITERGVEGTVKKEWPAGSVVFQTPTGSELNAYDDRIKAIERLGCIAAIPHAKDCENVKKGEWRCYQGCWRRALKDLVVSGVHGVLNIPEAGEPADEYWSDCKSFDDLLLLLEKDFVECSNFNTDDFTVDPVTCKISLNCERVVKLPKNSDCYVKGQWHFSFDCWRFALQSLKIDEHPFPKESAADEWWSKCHSVLDVLSLLRKCTLDIPPHDGCAVEQGHWRSNETCDCFRYALCTTTSKFPNTSEASAKWSKCHSTQDMLGVYNYLPALSEYFTYTQKEDSCEWIWSFNYKLDDALKEQCLSLEEPNSDCAEMRDLIVYRDECAEGEEPCWKFGLKPIDDSRCIDALPVLPEGVTGQEVVAYADPDCPDCKVKLYVKAAATCETDETDDGETGACEAKDKVEFTFPLTIEANSNWTVNYSGYCNEGGGEGSGFNLSNSGTTGSASSVFTSLADAGITAPTCNSIDSESLTITITCNE